MWPEKMKDEVARANFDLVLILILENRYKQNQKQRE